MFEEIVGKIKALEAEMEAAKPEFLAYITNKDVPLSVRWQVWLDAPDSLKHTNGYISEGRLEAFKLLGYGDRRNEAIQSEDGLVWADRYQTINMVDIIENILESLLDKFEVGYDEDFDYDNLDGYSEKCPEIQEFLNAYREELLEKNLLSYSYDW